MPRVWLARDSIAARVAGLLAVCLAGAFMLWAYNRLHSPQLRLGSQTYKLEIADTEPLREKGLGGRDQLAANTAMLFVFPAPERACFWMKNMRFPIDIVWLGTHKRIVKLEKSISPASFPATFCSTEPTKYVLELPAGTIEETGLHLQKKLDFDTI